MTNVHFSVFRCLVLAFTLLTIFPLHSFAELPSQAKSINASEKVSSVSIKEKSQPYMMVFANSPAGGELLKFEIPAGWQLGHKDQNKERLLVEFVKEGQKVEDWSELITISVFRDFSVKWDFFKNNLLTSIERSAKSNGGTVQASFFKEADRDALYSWQLSDVTKPKGLFVNQEVIGRLKARPTTAKGIGNLYEVSYASKSPFLSDPLKKKQWSAFLEDIKIYDFSITKTSPLEKPTFVESKTPL